MLKTLTAKPIELALTHAHVDHMYHADEFETVYMHENDISAWKKGTLRLLILLGYSMFNVKRKKYNINKFIPITEKNIIDIGNNNIKVILAAGHTPGSCIFVDEVHKVLFVGDAIGNGGASAWMWMLGCQNTGAYQKSLEELIFKIEPYKEYSFLCGHRQNTFPSKKHPEGLTLDIDVIKDMNTLCSKMLDKSAVTINKKRISMFKVLQYAHGSAGMWVRRNKIKPLKQTAEK